MYRFFYFFIIQLVLFVFTIFVPVVNKNGHQYKRQKENAKSHYNLCFWMRCLQQVNTNTHPTNKYDKKDFK